jgi:predicted MFS family arabinose efflux permease
MPMNMARIENPPRPRAASTMQIALQLSLGPMIALGLARFAYAIVLPEMRDALGLSFTQTGALGTANAAGYLAGTALSPLLARVLGQKRAFDLSAFATALFVLLMGAAGEFGWLLAMRFMAGACGAVTFIVGSALASRLAAARGQAPALIVSTYVSGVGIGLIISGLLVPPLLQRDLIAERWQLAWLAIGAIGLLGYALGRARWSPDVDTGANATSRIDWRAIWPMLLAYGLFGLGYISYMTFIIAYAQNRLPSYVWVMVTWTAMGVAIMVSPRIWRRVLDGAPRGVAFAVIISTLAVAVLVPLFSATIGGVLISAFLFGSFLMVPSAVTIFVRRSLPQAQWVGGMALATSTFSIGQTLGPLVSGALADATGSLSIGLGLSAGALVLGACAALLQKEVGST